MKQLPLSQNQLYWQLGLRAMLCVFLVWEIDAYFHIPRPYWGVLTVVVLVKQSWGEMISMAGKRLLMTIIGCGVGTILYLYAFRFYPIDMLAVVVVMTFLAVFFLPKYYASAMFCVGVLVVMLFGAIGSWNIPTLLLRIEQTALAGIIVVIVMRLFMPRLARANMRDYYHSTLKTLQSLWQKCLTEQKSSHNQHNFNQHMMDQFNDTLSSLRTSYQQVRYELLLHPYVQRQVKDVMQHLELSIHYFVQLIQVWPDTKRLPADIAEIAELIKAQINTRLAILTRLTSDQSQQTSDSSELLRLDQLLDPQLTALFDSLDLKACQTEAMMNIAAMSYYAMRLDEQLVYLVNHRKGK